MYGSYIGSIVPWACNFAPQDWLFCMGQKMSINQYQVLYSILGNRYGGDGQTYFNLPDLQGRFPRNQGDGVNLPSVTIGSTGGNNTAQLSTVPYHSHSFPATVSATLSASATNATLAGPVSTAAVGTQMRKINPTTNAPYAMYAPAVVGTPSDIGVLTVTPPTVGTVTGNAGVATTSAFGTTPPYLTIHYIICIQGDGYPVNPN